MSEIPDYFSTGVDDDEDSDYVPDYSSDDDEDDLSDGEWEEEVLEEDDVVVQQFPNWGAPRLPALQGAGGARGLQQGGARGLRQENPAAPPKISVTFDISTLYAVEIAKCCLFSFAKT